MKLIPINKKLKRLINRDVSDKTVNSTSLEVRQKIYNEIWIPNFELIESIQRRTLRNLKDSSK